MTENTAASPPASISLEAPWPWVAQTFGAVVLGDRAALERGMIPAPMDNPWPRPRGRHGHPILYGFVPTAVIVTVVWLVWLDSNIEVVEIGIHDPFGIALTITAQLGLPVLLVVQCVRAVRETRLRLKDQALREASHYWWVRQRLSADIAEGRATPAEALAKLGATSLAATFAHVPT